MSSLSFGGNANSYIQIPNSNELNFETGDFTIEWYQYQTDMNPVPRVFEIGTYPSASIGVSIEFGNFYYWSNGALNNVIYIPEQDYRNKWVHFAICRSNGITKIFMNGNNIFNMADTNNYVDTNDLVISNESAATVSQSNIYDATAFGGYISYFSWVKGVALYTANFTVPSNYPSPTSNYVLLLTASIFAGTLGNTVINNNVSTITQAPPGFGVFIPPRPPRRNLKSMFSDNSRVFYKPGSLASCGVGSVRNSKIKSRKI